MRGPISILKPVGQSPFHVTVIHDDDSERRPYVYELMQASLSAIKEAVRDPNFDPIFPPSYHKQDCQRRPSLQPTEYRDLL